ncbi:MAG: bifunctional oligoribonuclease/PAP phosphatase NrnA [Chthoniobacteraceae bacterium]
MPADSSLTEIAEVLREHQRFVVISHVRPDGDALGCTIAMGLCLRRLGKDVQMWNDDSCVERFHFLPGSDLVQEPPDEPQEFDVAIMLDTAVKDRGGRSMRAVKGAKLWINIDHHVSNPRYGDLNFIDSTSPATGQILFELFRAGDLPLTYEMADSLYVAISTDTGSFQYPNTTARTYEIGAELVRLGVNVGTLSQKMYESHPRRRIELLKAMLNVLRFSSGDRVASIALPLSTVRELGTKPDDTEGLIDHIRSIDSVIVAAFFEELEGGLVRVSLRSKDKSTDVCQIASAFGGGGHTLAAGLRTRGTLAEVQEKVLQAIHDKLPRN